MSRQYLAEAPLGPRTDNLAGACVVRLANTPLAGTDQFGELVPSAALEPAVALVREVMRQDRDLSAWIARKTFYFVPKIPQLGAVADADWPEPVFEAMGLGSAGATDVYPLAGAADGLTGADRQSALQVGAMARLVLSAVTSPGPSWPPEVRVPFADLYSGASGENVEEKAYAITAWGAIAIGRLLNIGRADAPFHPWAVVPEMREEGWYPNPAKNGDVSSGDAQFQRYWDGSWTDRVRIREARGWTAGSLTLHELPPD